MPFQHWTTEVSSPNMVMHEFFGPRRLGPLAGTTLRDIPLPALPLVGSGSLQMQALGANLRGHIYRTRADHRGYLSGTLRTRVHVPDRGAPVFNAGLYCGATSLTLTAGAGALYVVGLTNIASGRRAFLAKSNVGLTIFGELGADPTVLAMSAAAAWNYSTDFLMQLTWQRVGAALALTYKQGLQADGSDLATVLTATDPSPLTSPLAEGLWMASGGDTTGTSTLLVDETRITPQVL